MFWPFKRTAAPAPNPEWVALHNELSRVLEDAPGDTRSFFERLGPYAKPEPPMDPLAEASIYVAYGHISSAAQALRAALEQPERIAQLAWLPNGEDYAKGILARLEGLLQSP